MLAVVKTKGAEEISEGEYVTSETPVTTANIAIGVVIGAALTIGAQKLLKKYHAAKAAKNTELEDDLI
jgi:hypothetical protein